MHMVFKPRTLIPKLTIGNELVSTAHTCHFHNYTLILSLISRISMVPQTKG